MKQDTARIHKLLEALEAVWLERPDLRLGQLLVTLVVTYDVLSVLHISLAHLETGR